MVQAAGIRVLPMDSLDLRDFLIARGKEDGTAMGHAITQIALLHKQSHDECWICRYEDYPCTTLRLLAVPFVGHSDFQANWKP